MVSCPGLYDGSIVIGTEVSSPLVPEEHMLSTLGLFQNCKMATVAPAISSCHSLRQEEARAEETTAQLT